MMPKLIEKPKGKVVEMEMDFATLFWFLVRLKESLLFKN